jgi:hypothetical protein
MSSGSKGNPVKALAENVATARVFGGYWVFLTAKHRVVDVSDLMRTVPFSLDDRLVYSDLVAMPQENKNA